VSRLESVSNERLLSVVENIVCPSALVLMTGQKHCGAEQGAGSVA
jgi:hypothetical protein